MRISMHSKKRIVERDSAVNSFHEAKRTAKQARVSGKNIGAFQSCPTFFPYLQRKRNQANDCTVKVYHGNIYIWRGSRRTLVTAHPIPDRFKAELEEMDNKC